jgi:hypothetical protein
MHLDRASIVQRCLARRFVTPQLMGRAVRPPRLACRSYGMPARFSPGDAGRWLWLAAWTAVILGCDPGAPTIERLPGILQVMPSDTVRVEVPDTLNVGVDEVVAVMTLGGGCSQLGDTEVESMSQRAVIRPYDYRYYELPPGIACTQEVTWYRHEAILTFTVPGSVTIEILGIALPADTLVTVRRFAIVR